MTLSLPADHVEAAPLIDAEQAAFMQSGVSVNAGSCSAALVPSVVRALGCSVSADRRRVRILVSPVQAAAFLDDIRATGKIAVTFVRPSTHRSIQVKGCDAVIAGALPDDRGVAERFVENFIAELLPIGYDPALVRAVLEYPSGGFAAVEFTPDAAFLQSPGPRAGEPLKAGA